MEINQPGDITLMDTLFESQTGEQHCSPVLFEINGYRYLYALNNKAAILQQIPLFGVCLGLQGIVEYFGGRLDILNYPMHGKSSTVKVLHHDDIFAGFETSFTAARYHSLHANIDALPDVLSITAISEDDVVMAIAHRRLPVYAVQFHPEAILSLPQHAGIRIIGNLMSNLG